MTQELGRRERKKRETRRLIVDAALALFAERGYEDVTVGEIAAAADVDPSTFFRHFRAKEYVLFADLDELQAVLLDEIADRPPEEPILLVAFRAVEESFAVIQRSPEKERLRQQLMSSTPALQAQMAEMAMRSVHSLAEALARRLGVDRHEDPIPYMVAAMVIHAGSWIRENRLEHGASMDDQTIAAELPKVFGELLPVLAPEPGRPGRSLRRRPARSGEAGRSTASRGPGPR